MQINTIAFAATKMDAENRGLSASDASTVGLTASLLGPNPVVSLLVGRAMADSRLAAVEPPAEPVRFNLAPARLDGEATGVVPSQADFEEQFTALNTAVADLAGSTLERLTALLAAAEAARQAAEAAQKAADEAKQAVEAHMATHRSR